MFQSIQLRTKPDKKTPTFSYIDSVLECSVCSNENLTLFPGRKIINQLKVQISKLAALLSIRHSRHG